MDRIVRRERSREGPQPEREMDKRCVTARRKKGWRRGRQSELYAPISRVEVDESEMHRIGPTNRDIQLSQSAPCPSVYGKMVNVRLVWANVEDVRLNVVVNQRRGTWQPQHRCGGVLFVVQIQWVLPSGQPLRENGATLAPRVWVKRMRRAVGQRGCRGRKAKQALWRSGGPRLH